MLAVMIELLLGGITPPKNPLIETVKEPIPIVEVAPELTLEEKIAQNYYQCDESIQWIRADTAGCISKPTVTARTVENPSQPIKNASQTASSGLNGYVLNSCTGWVATHRYVPAGWGNATTWRANAIKAGWTVSSTPVVGSIGWTSGHVVLVEAVHGDTVTISERNYDYRGSVRTITVPTAKYQYIY